MSNRVEASLDGSSLGGCDSFSTQPPDRPDHTLFHTSGGVTICSDVIVCSGVTNCSGVTDKKHRTVFAAAKGWELFYLVASAMPPSKDYVGLVSEYVHTVTHNESEEPNVRAMAQRTWNSLKRSAKAGPRKTVSMLGS